MVGQQPTPPLEALSPSDSNVRKRVSKACERCRLRKSKCDGSNPCSKCKVDNAICVFGERKKSYGKVYPKGYIEMLEHQQTLLVTGLQEMYERCQSGQKWPGQALKDAGNGAPLTHDILDQLGALKQDSHSTSVAFEENPNVMQQTLLANGAGFAQHRDAFSDTSSEVEQSPVFEQVSVQHPLLSDPFAINQSPPTPPIQSPDLRASSTVSPLQTRTFSQPSMPSAMTWAPTADGFDDNMDFISKFDPSVDLGPMPPEVFQNAMTMNAMNPCLTMKDWTVDDDFPSYLIPSFS